MSELERIYESATGEKALYRKGSSDYHTLRYVRWLEEMCRPPAIDREGRPSAPVDVEKGTALASAALVEGVECRYHSFPGKQALCPIQRGPCLRKPCMITKGEG